MDLPKKAAPGSRHADEHILLLEDTDVMRALYTRFLEAEGYRVTAVESGPEALRALAGMTPDLILLDHMMPGMSGADVLVRIRKEPRLAEIPTVFLTASALDISKAFELGATDYFTKPIDRRSLVARVDALITSRRLAVALAKSHAAARDHDLIVAELRAARAVQESQIPREAVRWGRWTTSGAVLSCNAVGGDLFDVVATEEACTIAVVDVSGHGLAAAMVGSGIRGMLRLLNGDGPIERTMSELNRLLGGAPDDPYACVALVQITHDRVRVVNAGLPAVTAVLDGRTLWSSEEGGLPPGLFPDIAYEAEAFDVVPGMRIVIATDGVTDIAEVDVPGAFGRLSDGPRIAARIREVYAAGGRDQHDDATVVVASLDA